MDTQLLHAQMTVEEALQKFPNAFAVFMAAKTECPGCFMQHFCTLKDVAEIYNISLAKLLNELEKCA